MSVANNLRVYIMTHGPECGWTMNYCSPLEIGAACRDKHCCPLRDDTGDNISEKDLLYCELTGLYWMWKNDTIHEYSGLYHYRRVFNLSESKIRRYLRTYDWIVPKINHVKPSVREHYLQEHIPEDWNLLMETLEELYPEYYESALSFFEGDSVYFANMFVTSRKLIDDYCNWLFPILQSVEDRLNLNDGRSKYQQRVIGFMAERLFSLYLKHNNFRLKEVKVWYVPPYVPISKIVPKCAQKIVYSNILVYNLVLTIQDNIHSYVMGDNLFHK